MAQKNQPRVVVGRGVASWVMARGGRIFVWGEQVGPRWNRLRATTDPPEGVEFVRVREVTGIGVYVMARSNWGFIRLSRRLFGLRPGVTAAIEVSPFAAEASAGSSD